jgi:V-type H+-transporting ATPase subunit a
MRLKESEVALLNVKDCYQVLRVAQKMIPQLNQQVVGDMENGGRDEGDQRPLIDNKLINIERVAGVVESDDIVRFRKLIFRATKGKSFMYTEQFQDLDAQELKPRSVYIITYYDGAHIREKIQRICDSFSGQRFNLPELNQLGEQIQRMSDSIKNQRNVFDRTRQQLRQQLIEFDNINEDGGVQKSSSTIFIYKMFLAQEKALYLSLNMMKPQSGGLIGYFWSPAEYEQQIRDTLANQTATKITAIKDNFNIEPPTFNKVTDFTYVFQTIGDTYGIPTY